MSTLLWLGFPLAKITLSEPEVPKLLSLLVSSFPPIFIYHLQMVYNITIIYLVFVFR